jgi:hypothetical protein
MLTISIDIVRESGFWWIVLDMVVVSTALQMGYLAGAALAFLRDVMAARARRTKVLPSSAESVSAR